MKNLFYWVVPLFMLAGCHPDKKQFAASEIAIVPQVQKLELGSSSFTFTPKTTIFVENNEQQQVAEYLSVRFEKSAGFKPEVVVGAPKGGDGVRLETDSSLGDEGYTLKISEHQIEVKAAKRAGFFYAMQTLRQLLPVALESGQLQAGTTWMVPTLSIEDHPEFKWRGYMLDVSRHFFTKAEVMKMIDNLALHKINTFHLHLVDDQGWRIEIKKYPKLTEVGAWRVNQEDRHWNARTRQKPGEKADYGGFYTQEDIREMVSYAQSRCITIVPEIEMPAHINSALAAYPQLACTSGPFTVLPGGVWPITDIYCAGKDSTFIFLENVLTEVMDLFPSKYLHIGGDEATKTEWARCANCKKRIKQEGLKDVGELQSYFIKRIEKFINSKGRVLLGWDEILEGGLPPKATVMSWRGEQGGIDAARQGHDVVMTPGNPCYFDFYQGPLDQEPLAIGGFNPISKVYGYDPIPKELKGEETQHVLGAQANLWTEYVPNISHAEYMTFPRIAAMAEVLWSPKSTRNWDDFSHRLQQLMQRYDQLGLNYAKSAYKVSAKITSDPIKRELSIDLKSEINGLAIHYTTDGSEPTAQSPKYVQPVILNHSGTLKAVTVKDGQPVEKPLVQTFNFNKATARSVKYLVPANKYYPGTGDFTLVNAIRGTTSHYDGQWQGWSGNNMEVVVDLGEPTEIHSISTGLLQNVGSYIFFPTEVDYSVSTDGVTFSPVGSVVNDVDPLARGQLLKPFAATFNPTKAKFVKVVAVNRGRCPKGHPGEGKECWVFADELMIE